MILNIFAVMTAFFGVYLGFREATQGIVMNILRRKMPAEKSMKMPSSAELCCSPSCWPERDCIKRAGAELHLHL